LAKEVKNRTSPQNRKKKRKGKDWKTSENRYGKKERGWIGNMKGLGGYGKGRGGEGGGQTSKRKLLPGLVQLRAGAGRGGAEENQAERNRISGKTGISQIGWSKPKKKTPETRGRQKKQYEQQVTPANMQSPKLDKGKKGCKRANLSWDRGVGKEGRGKRAKGFGRVPGGGQLDRSEENW